MHKWFLPAALFLITSARAQYYYNDILSNRIAKDNFLLLKKAGIKKVTVASIEPDGQPTEGFNVRQDVSGRNNTVETLSQSPYSSPSILTSIYSADGWPVSASDSTDASVSHVTYYYSADTTHQLNKITTYTNFPGEATEYMETRNYIYSGGRPVSMLRLKTGKDTLQVNFITEEHGWVGEERWLEKGKTIEIYYYYYDAAGRVTDVTHFNKTAKKILPDNTFEYDGRGRLTNMVTVLNGTNQYRTWRYTYDARGLKIQEIVFNSKVQKREGKLTYTYE